MKKITKEEYLQEIEILEQEYKALKEKERKIIIAHENSFELKEPYRSQYESLCEEADKRRKTIEQLKLLQGHISYRNFYETYRFVENYFKEKYGNEIELPDSINDKVGFLFKNYVLTEDKPPEMKCFLHPYAYDDPGYFSKDILDDVNTSKEYFLTKKRDYVFTWELECLVPILYYDKLNKTNITNSLFGKSYKSDDKEFNELKQNFKYITKHIKKEEKLNLSLFLWTVFKTYLYFQGKDGEFVIDRASMSLIEYLLDFGFLFFNGVDFALEKQSISDLEKGFIRHMCGLLSNDLIHTIINCFPDYYSTDIMFLGYGCHIPAGCSDLTTSMSSFESFIKGICDYDYWYDDDIMGEDFLLNKLNIEKDYNKLRKEVSNNATI